MRQLPLFKRFVGSIIDKVIILLIFGICFYLINGESATAFKSGTYYSLASIAPSEYSRMTIDDLYIIENGFPTRYSDESEQEILLKFTGVDLEGLVRTFDLAMTFSFILFNLIYYLLFETIFGASLGKTLMKGVIIDNLLFDRISFAYAVKRAIIGGFLMSLAVGLRFVLDVNYFIVMVLFFLIVDYPVLIKKGSLIDLLSKVTCIERKSLKDGCCKERDEVVLIEDKVEKTTNNKEDVLEVPIQYVRPQKQPKFRFLHVLFNVFGRLGGFTIMKKTLIYVYLIWLAVNITALAYAKANPHEYHDNRQWVGGDFFDEYNKKEGVDTSAFYPFESYDLGNYDYSEFVVYTLAFPLFLFAIVKLIFLFVHPKTTN